MIKKQGLKFLSIAIHLLSHPDRWNCCHSLNTIGWQSDCLIRPCYGEWWLADIDGCGSLFNNKNLFSLSIIALFHF